ncbi:MAG: lipid-A-disaccharide synthase [Verrucomicrobia bacterium]|nr:lipid-A-disaccharide synthase [Verrucomicrobiota bacterium]
MLDLFIFAGELSADLHGARLLKELYAKNPELKIAGVLGPEMRKFPATCLLPMEKFAVMGFVDVLKQLPRLWRQFRFVRDTILKVSPSAVVTIDYADFSLKLAKSLRKKGYRGKICHYISPSVWAWRKGRIHTMAQNLDLLLTILPFEKQYFSSTSLRVEYVGHPLISQIQPRTSFTPNLIALFPGSRAHEVKRNLPLQLAAFQKLQQEIPELKCTISVAHENLRPLIDSLAPVASTSSNRMELMQKPQVAIAKSGTVTLELALYNVPTVVTYAVSSFDAFLVKYILRILMPQYCLVNIIGNKTIYPEFFGPHLSADAIAQEVKKMIADPAPCLAGCAAVRKILGSQDASQRSAELILSLIFK